MDENGRCAILVPVRDFIPVECNEQLRELERRGYVVQRLGGWASLSVARNQLAADALAGDFEELLWIDPDVAFDPADVERLRRHQLPILGGVQARPDDPQPSIQFSPDTGEATLGRRSALQETHYSKLSFLLVRRVVFEEIQRVCQLPICTGRDGAAIVPYFLPMVVENSEQGNFYLYEDYAFCERARRAGFPILANPSVAFWRCGRDHYVQTEACGDPWPTAQPDAAATRNTELSGARAKPAQGDAPPRRATPPRNSLRPTAARLPDGFPRIRAYVNTYPANIESARQTMAGFAESDWGEVPDLIIQDASSPPNRDSSQRNFRKTLERALSDGGDFALFLEDDVRVVKHLRHNLTTLSLVRRDQCDFLNLYMPDLIQAPWARQEPQLGYRLARPLYFGPPNRWEKHRLWGAQAYLLSRRLIQAILPCWDEVPNHGRDGRMMALCGARSVSMWYTAPSLVQHVPVGSCFATPLAYAADFDLDFKLAAPSGFQPPEEIPGWLTVAEGRLLAESSAERSALELGTACGRSTVCIAQTARSLTTIDFADQSEAAEWTRRFDVAEKVRFLRGEAIDVCADLVGPFQFVFIDAKYDAASFARDVAAVAPLLAEHGLLAFHGYPDPDWPGVRLVVDEHARRLGWRRIAQADYLAVFQT